MADVGLVEVVEESVEARAVVKARAVVAAREWLARKARTTHPAGEFDVAGRWTPDPSESLHCCLRIRWPSRVYPLGLMTHCRSQAHVANLYSVPPSELRAELRALTPEAERTPRPRKVWYKSVAVDGDQYFSIYDGETEYKVGLTLKEPVREFHGGGFYAYRSIEAAAKADVPDNSVLLGYRRALVTLSAGGGRLDYVCNCTLCGEWNWRKRSRGELSEMIARSMKASLNEPPHPTKYCFGRVTVLAISEEWPEEVRHLLPEEVAMRR